MKIFVTGGAGFLGSWLIEELLKKGHSVVSVDNFIGGYIINVIKHDNHSFYEADVTNLKQMEDLSRGCDIIFHTAATAYEGLSVFSPSLVTNNIVTGTTVLATAAAINNIKRFVNCSSMARYGVQKPPFVETMVPNPEDPYGIAKYAAEMQLNLLARVHRFDVIHAIPHNIIGPRQKFDDPFRNVASIMINLMLQGRQPIVYGDGSQLRCFSFVDDVLDVLLKFVDCDIHEHGEKFNVGPDEEPITIKKLAETIAELLNFSLNIEFHDSRPCEVHHAVCSSNKIRDRFGYETKTDLKTGLTAIINYVNVHGPRKFDYHLPIEIHGENLPRTWKDRLF